MLSDDELKALRKLQQQELEGRGKGALYSVIMGEKLATEAVKNLPALLDEVEEYRKLKADVAQAAEKFAGSIPSNPPDITVVLE